MSISTITLDESLQKGPFVFVEGNAMLFTSAMKSRWVGTFEGTAV